MSFKVYAISREMFFSYFKEIFLTCLAFYENRKINFGQVGLQILAIFCCVISLLHGMFLSVIALIVGC